MDIALVDIQMAVRLDRWRNGPIVAYMAAGSWQVVQKGEGTDPRSRAPR